jgi:putative PIN family toxin of toxin-antitoxin system
MELMRVVPDTNQIVAAGTSWIIYGLPLPDGNLSRRLLIRVATDHTGLYCGKIVGEYLEKLVDLKHPQDRAAKMIAFIMGAFDRVEIITRNAPTIPRDPDDEIFLLCAIDGQADYLVTDDPDLLDVRDAYDQPVIGKCSELSVSLGVN